jgi:WD40 repeat protein
VSGSWDKTIKVWDLASGLCERTLDGHSNIVMSVALSTCGKHLVSGGYDHTIKVWDARHYRRVPHVLIRSRVRATLATPADGPLLERQLLHYVYCRNNPDLPSAEHWSVIPSGAFRLVIKFLVG